MEQPQFINDEVYHVYCRGVEKRSVFMNGKEYLRAIQDLFEFNDTRPAQGSYHNIRTSEVRLQKLVEIFKERELLVEVLCFCLMPNHYHFLLRQKRDGGVTEFMRKFGTGYTNFFNIKHQRVGPLFQGKFRAVHITKQAHLLYVPQYIHLNPLDLIMPEWREKKLRNIKKALAFLESYQWSSYRDYIGKPNFPLITQRDFLLKVYGNPTAREYQNMVKEWLEEFPMDLIHDVVIE